EASQDSVSPVKGSFMGNWLIWFKFADNSAACRNNAPRQRFVGARRNLVESGAKHGRRISAILQRNFVGTGINAKGQSADDAKSSPYQWSKNVFHRPQAVRRDAPGPHHG